MSHTLFTRAPALRASLRRSIPQSSPSASYHSSSRPKMPSGTAPIRNLLRQTTLRASAIAAQRTSYPASQQFSTTREAYYTPPVSSRPRTPSPPPPYAARNISVLAPQNQWTRFTTPYNTLSSVRTFSNTSKRSFATPSTASSPSASALPPHLQAQVDAAIEEITDLYGTAKDEFEIASEETEKNSTYAEDDRAAAREELDRLLEYYRGVTAGSGGEKGVAEEVKRRVGGRIRELENAVKALEEAALQHD
ncbi:Nn.00g032420.m01.CDS01 [Neocucurbitaria sp. VM-36]